MLINKIYNKDNAYLIEHDTLLFIKQTFRAKHINETLF